MWRELCKLFTQSTFSLSQNTIAIGVFMETSLATVKTKSLLFLKACNRTRSTRSEVSQIVAEHLTNLIKSIKVDTFSESHIVPLLQFSKVN